jgi:hypothetical protein
MVTFVPSLVSLTEGREKAQEVPHSTTWLLAQVMAGGVVSTMVTVWLQVIELLHESVALHSRVALKVCPQKPAVLVVVLTMERTRLVPSQRSMAEGGIKVQVVPASTVSLGGQVTAGGAESTTVTTWLHRLVLRQESNASQVRVALKVLPQKPVRLVVVLTIRRVTFVPSQMSLLVGGSKLQGVPHSTFLAPEQAIPGGVVSITVMVWLHVFELPQWSVALQKRVALKVLPQKPA